jgi:uncharacterized sulfatase
MTKLGPSYRIARQTMTPVFELIDTDDPRPFLLWFVPQLPHYPHDAGPKYPSRYEGRGLSQRAIDYYANVTRFDDAVGQLLEGLESRGLTSRTLVVHLSDNGWDQGPRAGGSPLQDGGRGNFTMHEIGFRTPITFYWPGHVPAGVVIDDLVSTIDLVPTLLDYAGVAVPPGRRGRSLRPRIDAGVALPARPVIGWMLRSRLRSDPPGRNGMRDSATNPSYFLRTPEWRYIWHEGCGSEELYDLREDPNEEHDLSSARPEVARQLRSQIIAWRGQLESTLPAR